MKPTILVTRNTTPAELHILEAKYNVVYCPKEKGLSEAVSNHANLIRGLITNGKTGLSGKTISLFPKLEIISLSSTGYDTIDTETAKQKNIIVTHGQNTNDDAVADHAFALMLSLSREIVAADRAARTDQCEKFQSVFDRNLVCGKRLGILGLGTIGKKIAQRAIGFGMSIGYHNRNKIENVEYKYYPSVSELAKNSDWLVLSCPGGKSTEHIVNKDIFECLGPSGYIVNVARGSVVNTADLIFALQNILLL